MPLPKSLTQPFRQGNLVVGAGWRGFFAPFNEELAVSQTSTLLGPTVYDLEIFTKWLDSAPRAGWSDIGYVKKFKFTPGSKIGAVRSGYRGAIRAQYRGEVGEKMSFTFQEMSRLALSIASGSQVFNLLKTTAAFPASTSGYGPLSASGTAATPMVSYQAAASGTGATAGLPVLTVGSGQGVNFPVGSFLVCDQDYDGTSFGFVGDSGANVFQGAVSQTNVDFIRQTSDYVATVSQVIGDTLVLTAPFFGGGNSASVQAAVYNAPSAGAKVQGISGYASREGGTYIREWSAVFVMDTIDASQILFYYPRISPDVFNGLAAYQLENAGTTDLGGNELDASFNSLAYDDPLDGETVTRYMGYFPKPNQTIQA